VRRKKVPVIAITGNSSSTLATLSNCVLAIKINKEACPLNLAPTTSTTATLVLGDALAVALLSMRNFQPEDFALSHPGGSLGRKLLTTVSDIMHTGDRLPRVLPTSTLKEVVVEISHNGLGLVAVINESNKVIGVVTDGDLRRVLDGERDIRTLLARDFMTINPKSINQNSLAVDAVEIMNKFHIGGLLAVDDDGVLVGAFNLHDLFRAKLI
jgi:arabinose-5-phosphate isomerase